MQDTARVPWLAIVLGAVATIIGVIIGVMNAGSGAEDAPNYLVMAGALTTFGPVVISAAVSKHVGRREAQDDLRQQLDSLSMNLGHAAADLDNGLRRNAAGVEDDQVTLSIARSVTGSLEVQIGQIQKIIGVPFSAANLAANKEQLIEMGKIFSKAAQDNDPAALLSASRGIQRAVRPLIKPLIETTYEEVRCPACGHQFEQAIGTLPGSTAKSKCTECSTAFNVHRNGAGALFVRIASSLAPVTPPPIDEGPPAGASLSPPHTTFACTNCDAEVRYSGQARAGRVVLCVACGCAMTLNVEGLVAHAVQYTRSPATLTIGSKPGLAVMCPSCGEARSCVIRTPQSHFGFCVRDELLFEVLTSEAMEFLAQNGSPVATPRPTVRGSGA